MRPIFLLFLLPFFCGIAFGQIPCETPQPPGSSCLGICATCNFQGMSGESPHSSGGGAPGFCGTIHNDQWIVFVAGDTSVTLTLTTADCLNGDGLQLGLYGACGSSPIACNGGCSGCGGVPVQLSNVPLVIGQTYHIVIDGFYGDMCKWSLSASPLSAVKAPPVKSPAAIEGLANVCPDAAFVYSFVPPADDGASEYLWEVQGGYIYGLYHSITQPKLNGRNQVSVNFYTNGTISVTPKNDCGAGAKVSKSVSVKSIPKTVLPDWRLCEKHFPLTLPWGEVIEKPLPVPGTVFYSTTLSSFYGCDSTVTLGVSTTLPIQTELPVQYLCEGDSLEFCGQYYKKPGTYSIKCLTWKGCDSTIIFTINTASTEIKGGGSLNCFNGAVPLEAPAANGTAIWKNQAGDVLGTDKTYTATTAGTYTLYWTAPLGGKVCTTTRSIHIKDVDTLQVKIAPPGVITCAQPKSTLIADANMPASFSWVGPGGFNSNSANTLALSPGVHKVSAVTNGGCWAEAEVVVAVDLSVPKILNIGVLPNCVNHTIKLDPILDNPQASVAYQWVGPYGFKSTLNSPTITAVGTYSVTITNTVNGCTQSRSDTIRVGQFNPTLVQSISGGVLTCAQTSVTLAPVTNMPISTYNWSGPNGFSATQAQVTVSTPGNYLLSVLGATGCTQSISRVVVSNTIAPSVQPVGGVLACNPPVLTLNCNTNATNVTYRWSGPYGFLSNIRSPLVNRSGVYTVTVTNPANGCTRSAGATVSDNGKAPRAFLNIEFIGAGRRRINCSTTAVAPVFAWTGPNGFTSTEQNPVVIRPGLYTVLVTDGITDCQIYESILLPVATSANGKNTGSRAAPTGQGWSLSPNPSAGLVQLRYSGEDKPGQTTVTVLDGAGRIVASQQFSKDSDVEMDLSNLPQGLYRISLQSNWGVEIKSLSIQH